MTELLKSKAKHFLKYINHLFYINTYKNYNINISLWYKINKLENKTFIHICKH